MGRGTRYRFGLETADSMTVGNDLTVADDVTVSGTLSPAVTNSTLLDFSVNTTMFTVAAATGNAVVAGTFEATGASTLTGAVACGSTLSTVGAATLASLVCTAAATFGGGYASTGVSISAAGNIQAAGTLTVDSTTTLTGAVTITGALDVAGGFTCDTDAFVIANTTGVVTMKGGATLDNNAAATTLTITETNIGLTGAVTVTGALNVTGAFTVATNKISIAAATGIITMNEGATIDNDTGTNTLTLTESTILLVGATDVSGGAFTVGTNKLSVAVATGIITMSEGATIDNDTGTNVLTISETTITLVGAVGVTGALDVTGGFTTDTNAFAVADTTGIVTMKEGATIDNDTGTNTLTLTESTILLVGATDVSGGAFTVGTSKLSVAVATGIITMAEGATIDNDTGTNVLTLTENTITLVGSTAITLTGDVSISGIQTTASGVGAVVAGKCTVVEQGNSAVHKTVLTLTLTGANDLDLADGDHGTGIKIYDFPEGRIGILGAVLDGDVAYTGTNGNFYVACGTAVGADDNDLTSTEADIIPKITVDGSAVSPEVCNSALAAYTQWDGTGTAKDLYVNVACPDGSNTAAQTYEITGTLTVTWINLGDY